MGRSSGQKKARRQLGTPEGVPPGEIQKSSGSVPDAAIERVYAEAFSGPLPPPSVLQAYENVLPGAAERIFGLTEGANRHRQDYENRALDGFFSAKRRGQNWGGWMAFGTLVSGTFLLYTGHSVAGFSALLGAIAIPVAAMITGRMPRWRDDGEPPETAADSMEAGP